MFAIVTVFICAMMTSSHSSTSPSNASNDDSGLTSFYSIYDGDRSNTTDVSAGTNDVTAASRGPDVGDELSPLSSSTWHQFVVCVLCFIGAVGNALTVIVLSRHRGVRRACNDQETAVYCGMVSMAFADTMFCLALLPRGFIPDDTLVFVNGRPRFQLAYQLYSTGFVTTSALLGSWLVVATAGIRYIGICHPFRARVLVNFRSTIATILAITTACIVGNLPSFWFHDVIVLQQPPSPPLALNVSGVNGSYLFSTGSHQSSGIESEPDVLHVLDLGPFSHQTSAGYAFLWLRGIFGLFIPLGLLVFFNVNLINALRLSEQFTSQHAHSRDDNQPAIALSMPMRRSLISSPPLNLNQCPPANDVEVSDGDDETVYWRRRRLSSHLSRLLRRASGDTHRRFRHSKSVTYTADVEENPNRERDSNATEQDHPNQPHRWCSLRQSQALHSATNACAASQLFPVCNRMKMTNLRRRNSAAAKHWLTSVLVLSVLFFVVLVFPSDFLDFASHLYAVVGGSNPESLIAARPITNLLQVINYSLNFLLYAALNARFRAALFGFCHRSDRQQYQAADIREQVHVSPAGSSGGRRDSDIVWSSSSAKRKSFAVKPGRHICHSCIVTG